MSKRPTPPPTPTGPPRCALYLRVSSPLRMDRQTTENQLPVLQDLAARRGWEVVKVYEDNDSAKTDGGRPAFKRMLADAEARQFDVLVFWSLDRLTREGTFPTLRYLNQLSAWGVSYSSAQEQYLDTAGPFKDAIVGILGALARQESLRLSERVRAGLRRAQANGKKLGKPPVIPNLDYFRRANKVYSTAELMTLFGCCRTSILKYRKLLREDDAAQQLQAQSPPPAHTPVPPAQPVA